MKKIEKDQQRKVMVPGYQRNRTVILTVRLGVSASGSRSSELLGFGSTWVGNQKTSVIGKV